MSAADPRPNKNQRDLLTLLFFILCLAPGNHRVMLETQVKWNYRIDCDPEISRQVFLKNKKIVKSWTCIYIHVWALCLFRENVHVQIYDEGMMRAYVYLYT